MPIYYISFVLVRTKIQRRARMRVKKLISVVMCVAMILGNTLTYVNAEDLNGGSISAASET